MDYKETVFLPKTPFPMKANLAQREPTLLATWQENRIYQKLREKSEGREKFILHFGPPYANGHIHIGHALSEILKDIINKTYQMRGYDAPMVPGWDCHGLPIEWKVEEAYRAAGKNKDDVPTLEFRDACRQFAQKWVDIQQEEFKRLGIIADWDTPYLTMDFKTEAAIVEQLGHFLLDGSLYRGLKPVLWSVVEKTALADAEVEYKDHTSDSIYVAFPITETDIDLLKDARILIWTTTPWTLPGNRAIAYGPDFEYSVITLGTDNQKYILATDLVAPTMAACGQENFSVLGKISGNQLQGTRCAHPLHPQGYAFDIPLLPGSHVTMDAGTGLVHTAPGHGLEDFELGLEYDLEIPETVGPDGRYYDHIPYLGGQHIFKANQPIIDALHTNKTLFFSSKITHSYPHSWRSKAPLIYRTTAQWFISMDRTHLRETALAEIDQVRWIPEQGKNRIRSMVADRPDWCLSRQRAWGTPLTLFVHKETGEVLRDTTVHARIVDAIAQEGGDTWFSSSAERFLAPEYDVNAYDKVTDILDVWFDSGCSHHFVLQKRPDLSWPADLYLEGSDQHRGWFQSSLLASCGIQQRAPYRQVLTHGFVLDERGYKMSKSVGNVVAPESIIKTMGADLLRLWIVSANYSDDMRIGPEILKQQEDIYRRLRNTLRYLLGALQGFTPKEHIAPEDMPELEQYMLHLLWTLDRRHQQATQNFDFIDFYNALHHFCTVDLSAFYFDIRKDSLYCDAPQSHRRRAVRSVMDHLFECLTRWLAPVLSFTAEEAWLARYGASDTADTRQDIPTQHHSVHLQDFYPIPAIWQQDTLEEKWHRIRTLRSVMTGALEVARAKKTIGSSLQAQLVLYVTDSWVPILQDIDLSELAIASHVTFVVASSPADAFRMDGVTDLGVIVHNAEGHKCQRCWRILPEVGTLPNEDLCTRCHEVMPS